MYFPDFLFLMETKQKSGYMEKLKASLGYDNLLTVEPIGRSGGLAVMWKKSFIVDILSSDFRIIDLKVTMGSIPFYLTCVYGDPVRGRRKPVWDRLASIGLQRDDAWMLIGDFNELRSNEEKLGGAIREESTFWDFRNMADTCKIREHTSHGNQLSWVGWRDKVWVQCRLDRSFGNDAWFRLFPRSKAEYMDMRESDHRPLRLNFAQEVEEKHKGRFLFDKRLFGKKGVEEAIAKCWSHDDANPEMNIMDCIAKCRTELAKLKRSENLNSKTRIDQLKLDLEKEIAKQFPSSQRMRKLKLELSVALNEEERFWRQRSRIEWLREGDRNTAFFHNAVRGRRLKNKVLMLRDLSGQEHYSEGSKGNIAVEYYKDLFMSTNPMDLESLFSGLPVKITDTMNEMLTRPVTPDDIKRAAFGVKGSSAPGEDGLTGCFYQRYWHIVGPKIIQAVQSFFVSAVMPDGWNHTQLSLLPKILNPSDMKDMRPISLCSVQYKIISRILCDRLKLVLPNIVSETQGAFVAGRLITDNIIVAHEMVHGLRTNKKVGETSMAIKTDMSKAYDRVEWNFVEVLLEKMGFARVWINWIMSCINSVTYSVLLNGHSHGFIRPERGLRQGDPLSPFLFILCAEALVNVLNQAEEQGRLHGIKLAAKCPSVHHLLFADDSLLLCEATVRESEEIMACLKLYGEASGQVINTAKSSIIFEAAISEQMKEDIKESLGITQEGGEGTYLGLPECFKGSKKDLLNFIKEKLEGRLQGWYAKTLSMGAKEVLIKSVALALPIYAMSVFQLPKELIARLTSAIVEYWWSSGDKKRKIPWVAWQKLVKPKEQGGMGFHDIGRFNQALLGKQAWRIWSRPESLVARVLQGRYFAKSSFLECSTGTRPSFAWRSIIHGRELMKKGLYRHIGNGAQSNVWAENWVIDGAPRPPMYRADSDVNLALTVSDLFIPGTAFWNRELLFDTFSPEDANRILLLRPDITKEDNIRWSFTKDGTYTTRSGYQFTEALLEMHSQSSHVLPPIERKLWSSIWKIKAPPKIKHFIWRALSGALAVKERLQTRGIQVDATCLGCGHSSESICHVLFQCDKARQTWELANIPLPPAGFSGNSVFLNMFYLLSVMKNNRLEKQTRQAVPWILWQIWKARNSQMFKATTVPPRQTAIIAYDEAENWITANSPQVEEEQSSDVISWKKPPSGAVKCNVGVSWINAQRKCGVSWILRDSQGQTISHSRRSYSAVTSHQEACLRALFWAVESMKNMRQNNIIFETSAEELREVLLTPGTFPHLSQTINQIIALRDGIEFWRMDHAAVERNKVANLIALSVTSGHRYQSYIASQGPAWLHSLLTLEGRS